MPVAPTGGPSGSLDYFLGALNTKLEALQQGNASILARLTAGDQRFEVMDNRIQRIEQSLATLETDRRAAAAALERSAAAAASALERAAAQASSVLDSQQKRRLTRRDGIVVVGAGAAFSSLVVILGRVWDYVSMHMWPH